MVAFVRCPVCGRDCYPNQLKYSERHGCMACDWCRAENQTHGEVQAKKRAEARAKAWNSGAGYGPANKESEA